MFANYFLLYPLVFWFLYGFKLDRKIFVGQIFLLANFLLITFSVDDLMTEEEAYYLRLSVAGSVLLCVVGTLNMLCVQKCIRYGCNVNQVNADCDFILGFIFMIVFVLL